MIFEIIEVQDDKVIWYLYKGKKCLYDGEVETLEEANEMLHAAKELMNK